MEMILYVTPIIKSFYHVDSLGTTGDDDLVTWGDISPTCLWSEG